MPKRIHKQRSNTRREEAQPTEGPVEAMEQAQINENLRGSAEMVRDTEELLNKIDQLLAERIGVICVASS